MDQNYSRETDTKRWKTKSELAAHFGCDIRTVGNWMRRKVIPFVKIRGVLRFDVVECDAAIREFRTRTLLEQKAHALSSRTTVPQTPANPAPPPAGSSIPLSMRSAPVIHHGYFGNVAELHQQLSTLFVDGSAAGETLRSQELESGAWILLAFPHEKSRV